MSGARRVLTWRGVVVSHEETGCRCCGRGVESMTITVSATDSEDQTATFTGRAAEAMYALLDKVEHLPNAGLEPVMRFPK